MSSEKTLEQRRDERKAAIEESRIAQRAVDLEAIDPLEVEHGDTNVAIVEVPFTPGLPTMAAARTPTDPEMKRYQHRVKIKKVDGEMPDFNAAYVELATSTLIYPDADTFAKMAAARPAIKFQLGLAAVKLAQAVEQAQGKG